MMVPKKSLALTGAALFALGALAGAQNQSKFTRVSKKLNTVNMDLATGKVAKGPQIADQAITTTTDLPNLDLGGFIGVDTGGGFCKWIDSAAKGSGAMGTGPVPSDLVTNFVFAYCSSRLDVASGGTGGTMTWSFYPSHTTGANHPATSDASTFTLTGLPSNTAEGAVFAQIACFFLNITFGSTPLALADGQIGYAWTFEDLDTVGVFAATFPFLSCVTSCSGSGPDGVNMDDLVDQYCPPAVGAVPLATFSFGTTMFGGYFTSINIDMRELDVAATVSTYQGSTPGSIVNPDGLTTTPVIIGSTWSATVTPQASRVGGPAGVGVGIILVQTGGAPGVTIAIDLAPILIGFGSAPASQLLVSGSVLGTTTADWAGGTTGDIAIPLNTGFVCLPWYAQAIVLGDVTGDGVVDFDPMFSNAATGVVGGH